MPRASRLLPLLILTLAGQTAPSYSIPAETPVLITTDEKCQVSIDGKPIGTIDAGAIKKVALTPGEHLVSAVCPGQRKWKDTVKVAKSQKVVTIPPAGAAAKEPAAPEQPKAEAPEARLGSGCFLSFVDEDSAFVPPGKSTPYRWRVAAVIKEGPCDKAGIRPGSFLISLGGKKAQDLLSKELPNLDRGALGAAVAWELYDRQGNIKKAVLKPAEFPASGTMDVLQEDGKTIKTMNFEGYDAAAKPIVKYASTASTPSPSLFDPSATPSLFPTQKWGSKRCVGEPTPCSWRTEGDCANGGGCTLTGSCGGFAGSCFGKPQFSCGLTAGCFWLSATRSCAGVIMPCSSKDQLGCSTTPGCLWQGTCDGRPTPCGSLGETACGLQPGCTWK